LLVLGLIILELCTEQPCCASPKQPTYVDPLCCTRFDVCKKKIGHAKSRRSWQISIFDL